MSGEIYRYTVKIMDTAFMLKSKTITEDFPACNEILISSNPFMTLQECDAEMGKLLVDLAGEETEISKNDHVIISQLNPVLGPACDDVAEKQLWDKFTVARAFCADAAQLKKSSLKYNIVGQITVNQEILGLKPTQ